MLAIDRIPIPKGATCPICGLPFQRRGVLPTQLCEQHDRWECGEHLLWCLTHNRYECGRILGDDGWRCMAVPARPPLTVERLAQALWDADALEFLGDDQVDETYFVGKVANIAKRILAALDKVE